jgi:CRISPR type I-E-associated protein CasB/Cse2
MPEDYYTPLVTALLGIAPPKDGRHDTHRGTRAALRRLSRATPSARAVGIAALGSIAAGDYVGNIVAETLAYCFAEHPKHYRAEEGSKHRHDFGSTCQAIRFEQTKSFSEDAAFDSHFRRLLGCRTKEDVCAQVRRLVSMAVSVGAPINYFKLANDLHYWEYGQTRNYWARSYYRDPKKDSTAELQEEPA